MKLNNISIIICLFLPLISIAQIQNKNSKTSFEIKLSKANALFNEADYDSSIILFEQVIDFQDTTLDAEKYYSYKVILINLYLKNGDFKKADFELTKTRKLIKPKDYSNSLLILLLSYLDGEIKYKTGHFDLSRKIFTQCLEHISLRTNTMDSLKVLINKGLGNVELKSGKPYDALGFYRTAKEMEIKRGDKPSALLGSIYLNLAMAFDQIKAIDSAETYFLKSIDIKSKYSNNNALLAATYSNYSNFLIQSGKTKKALLFLIRADSLYKEKYGDDYYKLAFLYLNFAKIYMLNNDYKQALNYFIKSENIYRKFLPENDVKFESIKVNMALLYKYMSKYEKSIEIYNTEVLINSNNSITQIVRVRNIGECYLRMGNFKEADKYFRDALNLAISYFGTSNIQTATCYLVYSDYYSAISDKINADKCIHTALDFIIDFYGNNNREVTNVYNNYSNNLIQMKAFGDAAMKAQLAIISNTPGFSDTSIFANPDSIQLQNDYHTIAALALKTNALTELMIQNPKKSIFADQALKTALLGINLFENFKITLEEENSQLFNTEKINSLFQHAFIAAWQVYQNSGDQKYLDIAFQLSEKNKATILALGMNKLDKGLNNYVPDSLVQQEQNIKQDLRAFNSLIHEEDKNPNKDSLRIIWLQNKVFNKRIELNNLMKYLAKNYKKYNNLKNTSKVASIKDIQANLTKQEVLIEYAVTQNYIFIFAISPDEVFSTQVAIDNDFSQNVEKYLEILHQPPSFDKIPKDLILEYSNYSDEIYEALIEPIESFIDSKELIIIPDGVLGYLPFESLITSPFNESFNNFRKLPYMLKKYPISYHYSSTLFINGTDEKSNWHPNKALVMAPIYRVENKPGDSSLFDKLDFLKFTKNEAEIVHQIMGGRLFMDTLATESNFKKYASDYAILHLAMHTLLDDEDPLSSKLIFSPPSDTSEDGFLNTYEIYDLKLNSKMVVLSACETGSGKLSKGEGIMSMARGFLFAGVPSLLITHWKVNDAPAANIMEGFYNHLKNGKRKALQQAKLEYLKNSDQIFSHPYYWSAYVIIGDDGPIYKANAKLYLIILFIFLSGAISFLLIKRKN